MKAHKKFMAPNVARGAPPSVGGSGEAAGQEKDSGASASGKPMFGNLAGLAGLGSKIGKPPGTKPDKPNEA